MFKKIVLILSILLASATQCPVQAQNSATEDETESSAPESKHKTGLVNFAKNLGIDVAEIMAFVPIVFLLATIAHESGHAITTSQLLQNDSGKPIQIHIGTTNPKKNQAKKLFSIWKANFYKPSSLFVNGVTKPNLSKFTAINSHGVAKLVSVLAAGGVSAATFWYLVLSVMTGYCAYLDKKGLSEITIKSLARGTSPFKSILNTKNMSATQKRILINATLLISFSLIFNIFYGCTPFILAPGDGTHIWQMKELLNVSGIRLKVAQSLSVLGCLGSYAWLIKSYASARKALLEDSAEDKNLKN